MPIFQKSKSHFYHNTFSKIYFAIEGLGASVKWFFLNGSNNWDSIIFGNAAFREIKDHSLRTTPFQKKIAMELLSLCLPYVKRYFREHQLSAFFFMAQITQIMLLLGMLLLER